jgi:hypothetical protein
MSLDAWIGFWSDCFAEWVFFGLKSAGHHEPNLVKLARLVMPIDGAD